MLSSVESPHPGDNEEIVGEGVTKLVPPVGADDLGLIDLVNTPEVTVAVLVEENGLEHSPINRSFWGELGLVVGAFAKRQQQNTGCVVEEVLQLKDISSLVRS